MKWIRTHIACPCGKSSDAYSETTDGGYCFSCAKPFKNKEINLTEFTYEYLPWRGISAETFKRYGCATKIDDRGEPIAIAFPYTAEASKIREIKEKKFYWKGELDAPSLFGN